MEERMTRVQPILRRVDEQIRKEIPDLHVAVKWSNAFYDAPELGWILEVATNHKTVNVVFGRNLHWGRKHAM